MGLRAKPLIPFDSILSHANQPLSRFGCWVYLGFRVKGQVSRDEVLGIKCIVPIKQIEYGVYGDPTIRYPTPYSIYFRVIIGAGVQG